MQKRMMMAIVGGLTLLLGAGGLVAANTDSNAQRGQFSAKDYRFIKEASAGGQLEVQLGQLAEQKSSNPTVKSFGERMVNDHQKADNELRDLVTRKGATLPTEMSHHERSTLQTLQNSSGADFDKAYAKAMLKDHKNDLKAFQDAAQNSDDPDLKQFAQKTVSTLQEHYRLAQQMHDAVENETAK